MYQFSFFSKRNLLEHATFEAFFKRIADKTVLCLLLLALLPVLLRILLLPGYPAPIPQVYEEFSQLLSADTLFHLRLANPPHALPQFFESIAVRQQPTYGSVYPVGQGLVLASGRMLFGSPWAGVLLTTGAFCALSYWMLLGWMSPAWSLIGGTLAVFEFGPLNQWTNCYWGGALCATAGCLAFGALPRLRQYARPRDAVCLGLGIALQILLQPVASLLLLLSVLLFLVPVSWKETNWRRLVRLGCMAALVVLPALGLALVHNRQATGNWLIFPIQSFVSPQLQDQAQNTPIFGFAPLDLALLAFAFTLRRYRFIWVVLTTIILILGAAVSPRFLTPSTALASGLFLLMAVAGLQQIARFRSRRGGAGFKAAAAILLTCAFSFAFRWGRHLIEDPSLSPKLPNLKPSRQLLVHERLDYLMKKNDRKMLIFIRYERNHQFQDEWVYNLADIDGASVVWAHDLGWRENQKLTAYYPGRAVWLLEPDRDSLVLKPYSIPSQIECSSPANAF